MAALVTIQDLRNTLPQVGEVQWIGLRPGKREKVVEVEEVKVSVESGLEGDHYSGSSKKRQVTLIQAEHLQAMATLLSRESIDPTLTRRNMLISGINLNALQNQRFQIGEVILETTGLCYPCSRMEENLGPGGYNAMRGHGGITASVIHGGAIRKGDAVRLIPEENQSNRT